MDETILPRRVFQQRGCLPPLSRGGDCGACVLSGLTDLPIQEVYNKLSRDGRVDGFTWKGIADALWKAKSQHLIRKYIEDVPIWHTHLPHATFGPCGWQMNLAWFNYVQMAIEAGYYPICSVNFDKKGPFSVPDHWVMLVGCRTYSETPQEHVSIIKHEVLVNCSSTLSPDEEWVDETTFLKERGGFNCLLVKPL